MNFVSIISEHDHRLALDQAAAKADRPLDQLYAPLVGEEERWLNRLWSAVQDAILTSARAGFEAAREKIDYFQQSLATAATELGERAEALTAQLTERLNRYLKDVIDRALGRVEPQVTIGGTDLFLKSVTLQETFKLSSSLFVSISTICQMVAEGQVAVAASYEAHAVQ
jgi:hypothetical protein